MKSVLLLATGSVVGSFFDSGCSHLRNPEYSIKYVEILVVEGFEFTYF